MALRINPGDTRGAIVEPEDYQYAPILKLNADALFARVILTGDIELLPPINGIDGCSLEVWLQNGTGSTVNVTIDGGISNTLFVPSFTLDAGQQTNLIFRYDAIRPTWFLAAIPTYF